MVLKTKALLLALLRCNVYMASPQYLLPYSTILFIVYCIYFDFAQFSHCIFTYNNRPFVEATVVTMCGSLVVIFDAPLDYCKMLVFIA